MSKIFKISTLFSILGFLGPCCFPAERDYLKGQKGGLWRISLNIQAAGEQFGWSQERIHSELKKQAVEYRFRLEYLQKANKVKGALGNCASCRVQFVFGDKSDETVDIDNGREVVDNFSMTGFSTLRKTKSAGGGLVSCKPEDLETVRNWLFSEDAPQRTEFYTDTEIQIIGRLFCQGVLNDFIERYTVRNIRAVIIHIYTEDDPCGWCAQAMYNVLGKVSQLSGNDSLKLAIRDGTKLIFEVSSTRQHLHAREFGCDDAYTGINNADTAIRISDGVQDKPLIFFSRFSPRVRQHFKRIHRAWSSEAQEVIDTDLENLNTLENETGDPVKHQADVANSEKLEYYMGHEKGEGNCREIYWRDFNDWTGSRYCRYSSVDCLSWEFQLEDIGPDQREEIAKEQYRFSWDNVIRLENLLKQQEEQPALDSIEQTMDPAELQRDNDSTASKIFDEEEQDARNSCSEEETSRDSQPPVRENAAEEISEEGNDLCCLIQ